MKKFLMFFVALAVGFQSCDDHDDLWSAIDDLNGRVEALEAQVGALNDNVEALRALYGGATINNVAKQGDKWVITLSNGEVIELVQGTTAEAVIPLIGITEDGKWRYSVDNGATWVVLDAKAVAVDGATPSFRVDEATGYWQVSYDGETWTNVADTKGEPVKAVGDGAMTDRWFDDVKVEEGMFCVALKDGTTLRIPVLPDFLCKITAPEGVQSFMAGETKNFPVEIKGVESTIVTAPDGWKASLTEQDENAAVLTVVAPSVAVRAAADNSTDVAILAMANGYATIAKIQVESEAAVTGPAARVSNSITVAPTHNSLTFDVVVANADGWSWLCLKSSEPAPDAAAVRAGNLGEGTSVTVGDLEASTAYTLYVVAWTDDETGEVVAARNTTTVFVIDYWQDYLDGKDITIGTKTVNKTLYPDLELKTLADWNLTAAMLQTGGVFFVDNTTPDTFTIAGTSANLARNEDLVIIGRYAQRAQATLTVPDLRCNGNVAIRNMRLVATHTTQMFTSTNAQSHEGGGINPDLQLVDCTIDLTASRYLIYDNNAEYSFLNVLIDNSIVEYKAGATNSPALYSITTTVKPSYPTASLTLTNSVVFAKTSTQAFLFNCGDGKTKYPTNDLRITATGNTTYNIYQPNIMLRGYIMANLTVSKNVGHYTGNFKNYLTAVYDTANFTDDKADVSYNYLYTPAPGDDCFWSARHTGSYSTPNNLISSKDVPDLQNPFSAEDTARGYFPIDPSVVTTGAGAVYDTKLWFDAK